MAKLQLAGSFIGFENGIEKGVHDFRIESNGTQGSVETLTSGCDTQTIDLPSGLGDELTMDASQAFDALRHMQDRTKSIEEAFGLDIQPSCEGIQIQGVLAMLKPSMVENTECGGCHFSNMHVEKMAFLYRDGYIMISTLDNDGNWHSDAEKLKKELEGFSFKDLAAIICKLLATIKLSAWLWALLAICAIITSGAGAILCALGIMALELISLTMVIAIVEEVTGRRIQIAAMDQTRKHYHNGQLASARETIQTARSESLASLKRGFKHKELASWMNAKVTEGAA